MSYLTRPDLAKGKKDLEKGSEDDDSVLARRGQHGGGQATRQGEGFLRHLIRTSSRATSGILIDMEEGLGLSQS